MDRQKLIKQYHATCSHYAKPEEYDYITTLYQMREFFVCVFYDMKKFKDAYANPNCKNCFGKGFVIPADGERLKPCKCLRGMTDG